MTSPPVPRVASALLASLVMAPLGALDAQEGEFAEETSVVLVEVPVTVIHRGEPVEGLGRERFTLFDRGRRQEILSFEVLDVHSEEDRKAAPRAGRNFLFFFDLAFTDSRSLLRAAAAIEELLEDALAPGDRAGVGFFSALNGFQWVVGLSEERADARRALEVMRAVIASDRRRAEALLAGWRPPSGVAPPGAAADRAAILAESRVSGFNRRAADWPMGSILRSLADGLSRALRETDGLPGRKYLVHMSYGVPNSFVSGRSEERARVLDFLEEVKRACRAAGWAIHSVNLGGLGWGRDSLLMMADDTGGWLHTNSNDVSLLVREVEITTRVSYLLGFQPTDLELDGGYHRLRVEVSGLPRGAQVLHRPGYFAPEGPGNG